ncbi:MAG: hypothetical protein CME06_05385 [Gemmatimonadetes bacterium]|nr:hypothetical protein [Gemmatimonadota bacterium]
MQVPSPSRAGKTPDEPEYSGDSQESRRARAYQVAVWGAGSVVAGRCIAELRAGVQAPSEILVHSSAAVLLLTFAASVGRHASTHPAGRAFARTAIVMGLWFVTNRLVFREMERGTRRRSRCEDPGRVRKWSRCGHRDARRWVSSDGG